MSFIKPSHINLCEGDNHFALSGATVCFCGKVEREEKENMKYTIDNHEHDYIFNDDEQFIQPECKHCGLLKSTIEARPEPHQAEGLNEKLKKLEVREKCGFLIHVGFEGETRCGNKPPCPIRSHKPVDSIQPKGKFCMTEECDGDGIGKVPGGHVHTDYENLGGKGKEDWEEEFYRSKVGAVVHSVITSAEWKMLMSFIKDIEAKAQAYGESLGKTYWEPSEYHKEVWRKEGYERGVTDKAVDNFVALKEARTQARAEYAESLKTEWKRFAEEVRNGINDLDYEGDIVRSDIKRLLSRLESEGNTKT